MARKTNSADASEKTKTLARLRRIEGQVRGLHEMVEEERYCVETLTQIASVQQALRAVGRELLRGHLKRCAAGAIRRGGDEADAACDELIELLYKNAR